MGKMHWIFISGNLVTSLLLSSIETRITACFCEGIPTLQGSRREHVRVPTLGGPRRSCKLHTICCSIESFFRPLVPAGFRFQSGVMDWSVRVFIPLESVAHNNVMLFREHLFPSGQACLNLSLPCTLKAQGHGHSGGRKKSTSNVLP